MNIAVTTSLAEAGFRSRPNAGPGIWASFLLPITQILCAVKYSQSTTQTYKLTAVCSIGLLITTYLFIVHCRRGKPFNRASSIYFVPTVVVAALYHVSLEKGLLFSIHSGFVCTYGYFKAFLFVLKVLPKSFTFGEAAITTQSLVLLCYSTALNIYGASHRTPTSVTHISTLILQIGLVAIGILCLTTYLVPWFRRPVPFYGLLGGTVLFLILFPLHVLLQLDPLLWIFQLLFDDVRTIKLVIYWTICCAIAVLAVRKQIVGAQKANTSVRKIFHLLAISVFIPGLLLRCSLLFVASGVVLAFFILFELLRILNMPPFGEFLQDGFVVFADCKDSGKVAMTAIYLLVGCSLPMWIHPSPCDVTDSAGFNLLPLLSGLLIVGIGDSAASFVGARIGKHFWKNSKKTVEGTLACVLSQVLVLFLLIECGFIIRSQTIVTKGCIAIILASVVEALTDQVDNLVLPFIMFIILL